MPLFVIDLYLDGYDTEEEMEKACVEFIKESLDFSASSVDVLKIEKSALLESLYYAIGKNILLHPESVRKFLEKMERGE